MPRHSGALSTVVGFAKTTWLFSPSSDVSTCLERQKLLLFIVFFLIKIFFVGFKLFS